MPARRLHRLMACAAALCAGPAFAHHSIKMIEISSPVWLEATVVSYEPRNPHVLIHVMEKRADGSTNPIIVEGPIMRRLEDMRLAKDFIKPGDVLRMCGFPFKQDVIASNLPALHVHLLVLPDGRWQPWGPYGKLDNCVRPDDSPPAMGGVPEHRADGPRVLVQGPLARKRALGRPARLRGRGQSPAGEAVPRRRRTELT